MGSQPQEVADKFTPGTWVRVRSSVRTPYSGRSGVISSIDGADVNGAYLVRFQDRMQFRYGLHELEAIDPAGLRILAPFTNQFTG